MHCRFGNHSILGNVFPAGDSTLPRATEQGQGGAGGAPHDPQAGLGEGEVGQHSPQLRHSHEGKVLATLFIRGNLTNFDRRG